MFNKIKNIFKILIFTLLLSLSFAPLSFAAEGGVGSRGDLEYFFDPNDPFQEKETRKDEKGKSIGDDKCEVRCRLLNPNPSEANDHRNPLPIVEKYVTRIVDFDATSGVTTCDVYSQVDRNDQSKKHSIMANRKDIDCQKKYEDIVPNYNAPELASLKSAKNTDNPNDDLVKVSGAEYERSKLTVSKFIAGLATLDTDIVNLKDTVGTGTVVRTDGQEVYSISDYAPKDSSGNPIIKIEQRLYNAMDKLSRENLGYYVDLIYNMDKMYDYLIAYLFVFIALYFMATFFWDIALKKLAKKPLTYEKPWQTRLSAIVIAVAFFYIPAKFDENYSTTLFQNTWKFFVDESTAIADRANIIGMEVLMRNTYNTTGAAGVESEANLTTLQEQQKYLYKSYKLLLDEQCSAKYPSELTFQRTSPFQIKELEEYYGSEKYEFIYKGCRSIEARYKLSKTAWEQYSYMLSRIKDAYEPENPEDGIRKRLEEIDTFMNHKVHEIGWYSASLAPTLKLQVQNAYMQGSKVAPPIESSEEAKINEANSEEIAKRTATAQGENILANQLTSNPEFQKRFGGLLGHLTYSNLPGFGQIRGVINTLDDASVSQILASLPKNQDNMELEKIAKIPNVEKLKLAVIIEKHWVAEIVPLVLAFIASSIKIIMYIYELVVFTFISPFIVVFALSTADTRKIQDFLVTAVMIFLKPVLITISVYLALFLYGMFNDVFMTLLDEQFFLSLLSSNNLFGEYVFTIIRETATIFSAIASSVILWKVIMNMPEFVFKLIGINNADLTSNFADSMKQALTRGGGFRA